MQQLTRQQELDILWKDTKMENEIVVQNQVPQIQSDAMMLMIERVAANPDADIAKMEKLLDMRNQELSRVAKQAFAADFAEMQAELPQIEERTQGHNTKYASFEDINKQVQPVLKRYGFAVSFKIKQEVNLIKITAILMHKGGHSEQTEISLPADSSGSKNNVQAVGSSTSYGKRYAMCAILNIVTCGEDDDGVGATTPLATDVQRKAIAALFQKMKPEHQDKFTKEFGGVVEIKKKDVDKAIARINSTLKSYEGK